MFLNFPCNADFKFFLSRSLCTHKWKPDSPVIESERVENHFCKGINSVREEWSKTVSPWLRLQFVHTDIGEQSELTGLVCK